MKICSFSPFGYEGALVTVEVDLRRGIPTVDLVGLADGAVKESRERMRAAICNSGFDFPLERVLISLSPADLKKEGAGFDLAIALAVLAAKEGLENDETILVMGELELSGAVRSVRGVHAAVSTAYAQGITHCIVPWGNRNEAIGNHGMKVYGTASLADAFSALANPELFETHYDCCCDDPFQGNVEYVEGVPFEKDIADREYAMIRGQDDLVRALQIAAAGGHNLLAFGAPGCGKTMALSMFSSLLPYLTEYQAQPVTRIYSLAGLLPHPYGLLRKTPFRMPHQTASIEGMCGGGPHCRPGEISLAHNGVLFLDEAAEFKTSVLQMLRVPLESRTITLSRAGRATTYPADFQLLLATNPCPCGNFGSKSKMCLCSARSVEMYWRKFSGPLLDRIDIRIPVESSGDMQDLNVKGKSTHELRFAIARALRRQFHRQGKKNASLNAQDLVHYCPLTKEVRAVLDTAILQYDFSPRGEASCIKIARTIADMEGCDTISVAHMQEAIKNRRITGGFDLSKNR